MGAELMSADCADVQMWIDIAQTVGLPTLMILAAVFRGKEWMEGCAAIIAAFRRGEKP